MNREDKNELRKRWEFYLLFGIGIIVINTIIQVSLTNYINERRLGPPCRIDFPVEEFTFEGLSKNFQLNYLLINLRDKDLQIEGIDAYCYWQTKKESNQANSVTDPPTIERISPPKELEKIPGAASKPRSSNCRSPEEIGKYKIRIIARTTEGNCEGEILMNVKNE